MSAVTTERVRLREIDLTRHVRTEAGVRYFHKPIGSPIGNSTGHKVVKEAERVAKSVERVAPKMATPGSKPGPMGNKPWASAPRLLHAEHDAKVAEAKRVAGAKYEVRLGDDGKVHVDTTHDLGFSKAPLEKWEVRRVEKILNDSKTPEEIHSALLRATQNQKFHLIRYLMAQSRAASDYMDKHGDQLQHGSSASIARAYQGLYRIVPWMRSTLERARLSKKAEAVRDFEWAKALIGGALDAILKGTTGVVLIGLLAQVGIHLVGG